MGGGIQLMLTKWREDSEKLQRDLEIGEGLGNEQKQCPLHKF